MRSLREEEGREVERYSAVGAGEGVGGSALGGGGGGVV